MDVEELEEIDASEAAHLAEMNMCLENNMIEKVAEFLKVCRYNYKFVAEMEIDQTRTMSVPTNPLRPQPNIVNAPPPYNIVKIGVGSTTMNKPMAMGMPNQTNARVRIGGAPNVSNMIIRVGNPNIIGQNVLGGFQNPNSTNNRVCLPSQPIVNHGPLTGNKIPLPK